MKDYLDRPLTYDERLELIPALFNVAGAYFDETTDINIFAGICYQLSHCEYVNDAYDKMYRLMKELGCVEAGGYFENSNPQAFNSAEEWEPRAYMCLFLHEYLFGSLDDCEDIIIDESEPKSLWQKAKDKFNNFVQHIKDFYEARAKMEAATRVSV